MMVLIMPIVASMPQVQTERPPKRAQDPVADVHNREQSAEWSGVILLHRSNCTAKTTDNYEKEEMVLSWIDSR